MKKFYKILTNTLIVFLIIIVCLLLDVFIQVNIMNKDYANIFGYTYFQVATGSMEPTIKIDDIILIKLDTSNICENDIITYRSGNEFITHRAIEINGNDIIAKGDNNNTEDDPIAKENVIGKVVYILNDVSVWKKVFTDKRVIIPLIITAVLFIIIVIYNEEGNKD